MANAVGLPCVLGKSMLFRRSVAERFGGLKTLGSFLAEDYMMGYGVRALGLRIKLSSNLLYQNVDGITLKGFWNRHLRWAKMRKVMSPIWFKLEPFSGAILQGSFIGWLSTNALSISIPSILMFHLAISWALDSILILRVEGRLSLKHLMIWHGREILSFGIWVQALFDNSIEWKGSRFKLQPGGLVTR